MIELIAFWGLFQPERLNVIDCSGAASERIAYNTKTGDIYVYDSFKETYVPKKKVLNKSDYGSGLLGSAGYNMTEKTESLYVGDNLKIKEVQSGSGRMNAYSYEANTTKTITIFDANKIEKSNFKGKYSLSGFNGFNSVNKSGNISCKLNSYYEFK